MRTLPLLALAVSLPAFAQVGNLQLSTAAINFSAVTGISLPQSQIFGVTSSNAGLEVTIISCVLGANQTTAHNAATHTTIAVVRPGTSLNAGKPPK